MIERVGLIDPSSDLQQFGHLRRSPVSVIIFAFEDNLILMFHIYKCDTQFTDIVLVKYNKSYQQHLARLCFELYVEHIYSVITMQLASLIPSVWCIFV